MSLLLFLKAVVKKQIWIEGYTRHDGRYVDGHHMMVNVADDHDDHKVASGQGTYSQKKAHAKLSKHDYYHTLPVAHQAALILKEGTKIQHAETEAAKVVKYVSAILKGKKPAPAEIAAFVDSPSEKKQAVYDKLKAAGETFVDQSAGYVIDYMQANPKPAEKPVQAEAPAPVEPSKVEPAAPSIPEPAPSIQAEAPNADEEAEHSAKLDEISQLPKGNYKKQAHSLLVGTPEWNEAGSKKAQHDLLLAKYKELQSAATNASHIVKFKSSIKAGKVPAPAQIAAVEAMNQDQKKALIGELAKEVGGAEKLTALLAAAQAKAAKSGSKGPKVVFAKKPEPQPAPVDAGPKDGDTKEGADGTLVFKDGHWHKQAQNFGMFASLKIEVDAAIAEGKSVADIVGYLTNPQNKSEPGSKELLNYINQQLSASSATPKPTPAPKAGDDLASKMKGAADAMDALNVADAYVAVHGKSAKTYLEVGNAMEAAGYKDDGAHYKNLATMFDSPKEAAAADPKAEWIAAMEAKGVKKIDHDGLPFYVLSTGATKDGKTFAHLATPASGDIQKNGFNPHQINDWVDNAKLGIVDAESAAGEWKLDNHVHTKTGDDMPKVAIPKSVGKLSAEDYKKVAAKAKSHGGWWAGMAKGFLFKTKEGAQAFLSDMNGGASPVASEPVTPEQSAPKVEEYPLTPSGYLADGKGSIKQYANKKQAQNVVDKMNAAGYQAHVSVSHPFKVVVIKKPGDAVGPKPAGEEAIKPDFPADSPWNGTLVTLKQWADQGLYQKLADYADGFSAGSEEGKKAEAYAAALLKQHGQPIPDGYQKKIDGESAKQAADALSAPSGTIGTVGQKGYIKEGKKWKLASDGHEVPPANNIAAVLEFKSGHKPIPEWWNKADMHKDVVAELLAGEGIPASEALAMVFPPESGPKEGDTKVVDGVSYVLKNGRWHKANQDQPAQDQAAALYEDAAPATSSEAPKTLDELKLPEFKNISDYGKAGAEKFLNAAKEAAASGHATLSITTTKKKVTVSFPGFKQAFWNPLYHSGGLGENNKAALAYLLSAKALAGGKPNADLVQWMNENGAPVAGFKAAKKKATPKEEAVSHTASPEPTIVSPIKKLGEKGPTVTVMDAWEQTGSQGGSNPGGKFKDKSGKEWYCKFPGDDNVVKNELLAAKFYQMLGVKVPNLKLVEKDGKLGIASQWEDGLKKGTSAQLAAASGAHDAFVFDAWLANWDVVGMSNDNLMLDKDGKAVRVDVGGSLVYRAQGGEKGAAFGADVSELDSLIDPAKNSKSAAVFSGVSKESIEAGAQQLAKMHPNQIKKMCHLFGPGSRQEQDALADKLIARREHILNKMGIADPWNAPPVDITKLTVNPADLPKPIDFLNFNGEGKGLSSSEFFNKQNSKDSADLVAFAAQGNLKALQEYEYDAVDKATGAPLGKKPMSQHPSAHIKNQWASLCDLLTAIANPPVDGLDLPPIGGGSVEEVSHLAGFFKPGENIHTISKDKVVGFWMKLGHVGAESVSDLKPKSVSFFSETMLEAGKKWYSKIAGATKAIINAIQDSGQNNRFWNNGDTTISVNSHGHKYSGGAQSLAAQCYADAKEQDEGTTIGRWMNMPQTMMDQLLNEGAGLVLQNADSMCCSVFENWGDNSHFGSGAFLNIRYAKGAKALESYGSGRFNSTEREVTTLMGQRFVVLGVKKGNASSANGITMELLMLPPHEGYLSELGSMAALGKSMVLFFTRMVNRKAVSA